MEVILVPFTFLITFNFLTWFIYRIQDTEYEQFKADMHGVTSFRL